MPRSEKAGIKEDATQVLTFFCELVYVIHVRTLYVLALQRQQSSITWIFPTLLGHIYDVIFYLRM